MDSYSSQKILIDKAQIDRLLQFYSPITSEHDSVQIALASLCHRLGTASAAFERLDRALSDGDYHPPQREPFPGECLPDGE